ncbi:hypothetical protein ACEWY4_007565 [Coilia grayii]|uniref:Integrase catalytic domain-containing protein n=1 Tax=Coilia grayii TaxID=363190 RepID=A0ABD1KHL6_9TELE
MDLVGKLTPTTSGNQYLCVMVDYYTKWVEAFAIPNKSAEVVTQCILKFFYRFGAPQRLLTDQGTEFVNEINPSVEDVIAQEAVSRAISLKQTFDTIVKDNVKKKQEKRHRILNPCPLAVGEKVLRKNIRTLQRKGGKLERSWLGPYTITKIENKSADLLDKNGILHPKINIDHLKPFIEQTPRLPHRIHTDLPPITPSKKQRIASDNSIPLLPPVGPSDLSPLDLSAKPLPSSTVRPLPSIHLQNHYHLPLSDPTQPEGHVISTAMQPEATSIKEPDLDSDPTPSIQNCKLTCET